MTHNRNYACIALLLAVVVAGCDDSKSDSTTTTTTEPAASSEKIAVPPPAPAAPSHSNTDPHAGLDMTPTIPTPTSKATVGDDSFVVAGIELAKDENWETQQPASSMRLAQLGLPGEAGAAELQAFCFGPGQGGDARANIDRWLNQIPQGEGDPDPTEDKFEANGLTIHTVKAYGTYNPGSMGPMAPKTDPTPGYAMIGIIIEGGPGGSVFLKAIGPKETINAQEDALMKMAKSAKLAG